MGSMERTLSTVRSGRSPIIRVAAAGFSACASLTMAVSVNWGHSAAMRMPLDFS